VGLETFPELDPVLGLLEPEALDPPEDGVGLDVLPAAEVPPDDPDQLEPLDEPDTGVGLEVFPALGNEGRLTLVDCVSEEGGLGAMELSVLGKLTGEVELTGAALFSVGMLS
jgi:hypothetical protein